MNYNWVNFQGNQRTFLDHFTFHSFTKDSQVFFFYVEILCKIFPIHFIKEFTCKLIGDLRQKILQRIPFNFDRSSFYKEFPWKFLFTGKSFVKIFPIFKLESDFFPHFFSKIRKDENCENLFTLNYNWANSQQNQRIFFSSFIPITRFARSLLRRGES